MSAREEYVASLKVEREAVASRPADSATRTRRLKDIDAELDRYADEPAEPKVETAEAGPVTRARRKQ